MPIHTRLRPCSALLWVCLGKHFHHFLNIPVLQLTFSSDLADAFPDGQFAELYSADWIVAFVKEVRANREFGPRTTETARWAREQVRRQLNIVAPVQAIQA